MATDEPIGTCEELYRCQDCGEFLECKTCSIRRHSHSPLHNIRVWRDECWTRTTLGEMGLVYQLGHQGGPCPYAEKTPRLMTVIHINGIHIVPFHFCSCYISDHELPWQQVMRNGWYPATAKSPQTCATMTVLNFFRRMKVTASVNVRDFLTTVERITDPYNTEWTPDRYKAFGRMQRQWNFLMRVRRSGLGHEEGGLDAAKAGALIVQCWACPRLEVNLPPNWQDVAAKYQYRFQPIVSADANFRMKEKMKPEPRVDWPLYDGLGVQPNRNAYLDWLATYVTEEEVSTCIAFAALLQKNTRFTEGLRTSGVIGVCCARHELLLGLGDLQKGERYVFKNTDYILYSALSRMGLQSAAVTYDIACQYKKNWGTRIDELPAELREHDVPEILWALPVWHGNVHDVKCETSESLKYKVGVGKTDGEGIERIWAVFNPFSYMTREEHPGARHDDIEDKTNHHNFLKNTGLGDSLLRKLKIALEERMVQVASFDEVNSTLRSDLRSEWGAMVVDWLADPTKPNPYAPPGKNGFSEATARRDLEKEEAEEEAKDRATEADGEQAEDSDCEDVEPPTARLVQEKTSATNLTLAQESKVHQRRRGLTVKIKEFRKWQAVYMPGVDGILKEDEHKRRETQSSAPLAEDVKLYLPSQCAGRLRRRSKCPKRLINQEATLRKGQCSEALDRLRSRLIAKRYLTNFRNAHHVGQKDTTRSSKLLSSMSAKVQQATRKYRVARAALADLTGEASCGAFRVLHDSDVKVYQTAESDAEAVKKLGRLDRRDSRRTVHVAGETRATMSWIWTASGGPDAEEDVANPSTGVRIEWAKALARKTRWAEEVELLKEEMRRVLRTLKWEEEQWSRRANAVVEHLRLAEAQGRRGYALRQMRDRARIRESFEELWLRSAPARGRKAGAMDGMALAALTTLIEGERRTDEFGLAPDMDLVPGVEDDVGGAS
ncbi:hypothetical protein BDZ89DRAFT_944067 [Hymenopellis radicata]|nr:hypothetical protein BDZ89DRAFT_944067 [Hymenopellis radicata]